MIIKVKERKYLSCYKQFIKHLKGKSGRYVLTKKPHTAGMHKEERERVLTKEVGSMTEGALGFV